MKRIIALGITLLFLTMTVSSANEIYLENQTIEPVSLGNTLYVGGNGTGNYSSIQDAINDSSDGDTVFVYDDSSPYYENLDINKSINLIGENRDTTEIYYWDEYTITITADWINISGFKLKNYNATLIINSSCNNISNNYFDGDDWDGIVGIELSNGKNDNVISDNIIKGYGLYSIHITKFCSNTTISNNKLSNNLHDIVIRNSCHNTTIIGNKILDTSCCAVIAISNSNNNIISDNYIAPRYRKGIDLFNSNHNTINNNTIIGYKDRFCDGIELTNSKDNIVFDNSLTRSGLTVMNSSQNMVINNTVNNKPLIYLENISDSIITNDTGQIVLIHCNNITIKNQDISYTTDGISLGETTNCSISDCFISRNSKGIKTYYSNNNTITGNNITNNGYPIEFWNSQYNTINNNNITNNHEIRFWNSHYNTIMDNFFSNNSWSITFVDSQYNSIIANIIKDGYIGIELQDSQDSSTYNKITSNSIFNQDGYGIYIWSDCYDNIFYHNNFFNNKYNARDKGSNIWDNGYPSGGNYWDDYTGNDSDGDGIGDTPYPIPDGDNEDRYPLMNPFNINDSIPPVTTILLNPPNPDGDNDYYVNPVNVTLKATDEGIGVKAIKYRVDGGIWKSYYGDWHTFVLDYDCLNDGLIEYYSIDYFGNEEEIKSISISMDLLPPEVIFNWDTYKADGWWYVDFIVHNDDFCSGMDRIEFFINDGLHETITGSGPDYVFTIRWSWVFMKLTGKFYCFDRAGNVAIAIVNFSDIESYPYSYNMFFWKWLERFPILNQFIIRIMERWII